MKWVKGGKWQVRQIDRPSAVEYTAFLLPIADARGIHQIGQRVEAKQAARAFLDRPDRWNSEIGQPAGLEVYVPARRTATALLREMESMDTEFEVEFRTTPLEECSPPRREAIIRRLVQMLENYGPLRGVDEVIDFANIGVEMPDEGAPRSVSLDMLILDLAYFAETYRLMSDEGADRRSLARRMQIQSTMAVRDVRVIVDLDADDQIRFAVRPVTLRAFLWEILFDLHDRRPGNCQVCGQVLSLLPVRGRPFAYCPDHRGTKYRTATYEKKLAKERSRATSV